MNDKDFINGYYERMKSSMVDVSQELIGLKRLIQRTKNLGGKMIFAGNGASNLIGSHAALDFLNQLGILCISINDGSYITAVSNDFGYDNIFERYLDLSAKEEDLIVLISSSGSSPNVINAAIRAKEIGAKVVTFSGFKPDNKLRILGDINFYVDNNEYNIVESIHNMWLVSVLDLMLKDDKDIGIHGIEFNVKGINQSEL